MNFYNIIQIPNINIGEIENSIYEWKILNCPSYSNSLIYYDDNLIKFYFEIENMICNFKIKYYLDNWKLEFDDQIDRMNIIHLKILNMIDIINNEIKKLPTNRLPDQILNIIELQIEYTDFDDTNIEELDIEQMLINHGFNFIDTNS